MLQTLSKSVDHLNKPVCIFMYVHAHVILLLGQDTRVQILFHVKSMGQGVGGGNSFMRN